jgi:hypothetical protein
LLEVIQKIKKYFSKINIIVNIKVFDKKKIKDHYIFNFYKTAGKKFLWELNQYLCSENELS